MAAGALNLDQARVIVAAIEDLPTDLDPTLIRKAEQVLLAEAAIHDAKALRVLGEHVLTVIAPQVGEERDRKNLERAEALAAQKRRLTMTPDGHGSVHGRFTLPQAQAEMLTKALHAIAAPKHRHAVEGPGSYTPGRPTPQRLGEAFAELLETLPAHGLPKAGRTSATIVVTITLEDLLSGLGHAVLDTGGRISATQARRLACEARIIPAVLGGKGEVLDVGRASRFHTGGIRTALDLRDKGCTAQGCDWPPFMCHAHHDHPWSLGGTTNLATGRLLCPHHHARAHDPTYTATTTADNKVLFHHRT